MFFNILHSSRPGAVPVTKSCTKDTICYNRNSSYCLTPYKRGGALFNDLENTAMPGLNQDFIEVRYSTFTDSDARMPTVPDAMI
jgi:hypothetical protein